MTDLRKAAQQALEALNSIDVGYRSPSGDPLEVSFDEVKCEAAITALRAALAQEQAEPVAGIIESEIRGDSRQTLDDAMQQPRAMAQAYENGYKAGAAAERKRIIQFLTEMQRQVGDGHNYYGVAAMRIREMV